MKRRSLITYSCLFLASYSLASCQSASTSKNAIANWPKHLRFTVTDANGAEELKQEYQAFRNTLEEVLDCEIVFFPVESFVAAAPAMIAGDLDLAWAGPSEYLILQVRANAVPIVALKRPHFRTSIAVRGDRGIESLTDLEGKIIDINDIGSTGSHLGTVKLLLDAGVNLKEVKFIATRQRTMSGLIKGEIDALGRPEHRYRSILEKEGLSPEDYPLIALGEPIPGDVFVASARFDPPVVEEMRSRLLAANDRLMATIWSVEDLKIRFKDAFFGLVNNRNHRYFRFSVLHQL